MVWPPFTICMPFSQRIPGPPAAVSPSRTSSATTTMPLLYAMKRSGSSLSVSRIPLFTFPVMLRKERTLASSKRSPYLS